jgi:hypothetical protein
MGEGKWLSVALNQKGETAIQGSFKAELPSRA